MAQVQPEKEESDNRGKESGIRILLHSKKRITSFENLPRPSHSDDTLWDIKCSVNDEATSRSKVNENFEKQSHKVENNTSNSINLQSMDNQRQDLIIMPEITSTCELTTSGMLRLSKTYEASKHSPCSTSITTHRGSVDAIAVNKVIHINTFNNDGEEQIVENMQERNIDASIVHKRPRQRRGRPRKDECSTLREDDVVHTCKRVVKTKSRTVVQQGECDCVCNYLMKDRDGNSCSSVFKVGASESVLENSAQGQNISKRKCLEGNFENVKEYVSASSRIRDPYKPWRKNYEVVNGKAVVPEYKIQALERHKRQMEMRACQRYSIFHTWESVLACKNRVEEETRSKYNLYSITNGFRDDKPRPNKRVLFELKRSKGDAVVVPCSGIPLMWIGNQVYRCHLGKPRFKTKAKLPLTKKCHHKGDEFDSERPKKSTPSKKVGCPATFSVTKIARFPDFELTDDNKCKSTVSTELRSAWSKNPEKVRYYIEYYVKRPRLEDHQGHIFNDKNSSAKFLEPIDPKILQKIHDLTCKGVTEVRQMKKYISAFVREEIFKDCDLPPPERRRYNPRVQDYRNAMKKARLELQKAGRSFVGIQCSSLIKDIGEAISTTCNEEYLDQLKELLTHLLTTVRDEAPLDPFLSCHPKTTEQPATGLFKKRKPKKIKPNVGIAPTNAANSQYSFCASQPEQVTQVVYQDELPQEQDAQLEGVTQIYYYQQMTPGEEVYTTEVVDSAAL